MSINENQYVRLKTQLPSQHNPRAISDRIDLRLGLGRAEFRNVLLCILLSAKY